MMSASLTHFVIYGSMVIAQMSRAYKSLVSYPKLEVVVRKLSPQLWLKR